MITQSLMSASNGAWGDNGNGTYNNPILPADYSDPDVIRVGDDYFLITSTFQLVPGITVLHSRDMVNWQIIGGSVKDLTRIRPDYDYSAMPSNRYGRIIWAPCITYNTKNGTFYIHFATPDEGLFVVTATKEGIWKNEWSDADAVTMPDGVPLGAGWNDCGVLWDDDGQGYIVINDFQRGYKNYLFKLSQDGKKLQDNGVLIHESGDGMLTTQQESRPEAYKMFKKDGYYYFLHNAVVNGLRELFFMRARNIYGDHADGTAGSFNNPGKYEHSQAGVVVGGYKEWCQGNIIDTPDSYGGTKKWYFLTHQGAGGAGIGRPVCLIPVEWEADGFPATKDRKDRFENIPKPLPQSEAKRPQTSDDFNSEEFGPQWMWNYQPKAGMWSLTERPGFLRMHAYKPIIADRIDTAGNSLVQRSYKTEANIVKTKFDISGMTDGQNAGLLHSSSDLYGGLGVRMYGGKKYIYAYGSGGIAEQKAAVPDGVNEVYFKSEWYINMQSTLYYSFDGTAYIKAHAYAMQWHRYRGDYIGFFNYNNNRESGYIDIDYFTYEMDFLEKAPFEKKMMTAADSIVVDTKYLGVGVRVPTRGLFGSKISWACNDETAVLDNELDIHGRIWIRIKRPKEGVKKVTLKAELSVEEETYCACFEADMPFGYSLTHTGKNTVGVPPENMAFEDPIFDGAADPTLVYNRGTKEWWIFYTQRRASVDDEPDFHWVFGSEIGIAKSADCGSIWEYAGIAKGLSLNDDRDTFWAPEVIYNDGVYHMYLSYVRGRPRTTAVQSSIEHYTSRDLINWKHESKLPAPYNNIIDPCVFRLEDGKYAMWFKNQNRGDATSVCYSDDLYNWTFGREDIGIGGRKEASNVFYWNGQYNMILDFNKRLTLFESKDGYNWSDVPTDIGGQHGDVVNQDGKAILVYFAENYNSTQGNKTAIYINELLIKENGTVWCDHTAHFNVKLNAPEIRKMEIKKSPVKLVFEEGASLELSGLELSVQFADSMGDTLTPADFEEYSITTKLVPGNESGKGEVQISAKYGGTVAIPVTVAERR